MNQLKYIVYITLSLGFVGLGLTSYGSYSLGTYQAYRKRWLNVSPKTYLLSYPRSGNTWMRYCIEELAKRPTLSLSVDSFNRKKGHKVIDFFSLSAAIPSLDVSLQKPPIWKVHNRSSLLSVPKVDSRSTLILIVRNYKEVLIRQLGKETFLGFIDELAGKRERTKKDFFSGYNYFDNLLLYHRWNSGKKLLIYYDELINNPALTLKRLLTFLKVPITVLPQFLEQLTEHKKKAITVYNSNLGKSITQGKHPVWHSRMITHLTKKWIDTVVAKSYPVLWKTYLRRYAGV